MSEPLSASVPRDSPSRALLTKLREIGTRPLVCGVLNVTPDSFSDGGRYLNEDVAVERGLELVRQGADLVDVGGESTKPGANPVGTEEELRRVIPVVRRLRQATEVPISVDTSRPAVMVAAVEAGAAMINDVRALRLPGALETAADLDVPTCLMHMQGSPETMQVNPRYHDVVSQVYHFLRRRMDECAHAGLDARNLVVDPGFGFGKTLGHNLDLLASLDQLQDLGAPIFIGVSRKSMIGELTGRPVPERLGGSVAAALIAAEKGVRVVRAHDVAETRDALVVAHALRAHGAWPQHRDHVAQRGDRQP